MRYSFQVKPISYLMANDPATFEVLLTKGAEQDLEALHDYIAEFDCVTSADHVLDELMRVAADLSKISGVRQLSEGSARAGRQGLAADFLQTYRVIYRVIGRPAIIHRIVDGRRDRQSVPARGEFGPIVAISVRIFLWPQGVAPDNTGCCVRTAQPVRSLHLVLISKRGNRVTARKFGATQGKVRGCCIDPCQSTLFESTRKGHRPPPVHHNRPGQHLGPF